MSKLIKFCNLQINTLYTFNDPLYLKDPKGAYGEKYKDYLDNGKIISNKLLEDSFDFINKTRLPDILYIAIGACCKEAADDTWYQQFPSFLENLIYVPDLFLGIILIDINIKIYILKYIISNFESDIKLFSCNYNIIEEFKSLNLDDLQNVNLHYTILFKNNFCLKLSLIPDWLYKDSQYNIIDLNIRNRNLNNFKTLIANFAVHYNSSLKSFLYSKYSYEVFDFRKILTLDSTQDPNVNILEWGINYTSSIYYKQKIKSKNKLYDLIYDKEILRNYLVYKKNIKKNNSILTPNEILIPLKFQDDLILNIYNDIYYNDIILEKVTGSVNKFLKEHINLKYYIWDENIFSLK